MDLKGDLSVHQFHHYTDGETRPTEGVSVRVQPEKRDQ